MVRQKHAWCQSNRQQFIVRAQTCKSFAETFLVGPGKGAYLFYDQKSHSNERTKQNNMSEQHSCTTHGDHPHVHGTNCGHIAVKHSGHVDYLHDGHLHHPHGDHVDEHKIDVGPTNPNKCTPGFATAEHAAKHVHGPKCGHPAVPHGDHVDYLVDGRLHHPHGDHCDDHGPLIIAR
jgi:hypothetical protein